MQKKSRLTGRMGIVARSLFLTFGLASPWRVSAEFESMRFEHLTINDGLSQSSINALAQDRRGYLWIGTQDGLNRYDGYRFDVMRNDPDDPRSLANNSISSIFEDSNGVLWVGTTGSTLHRYVPESSNFERYPLPGTNATDAAYAVSVDVRAIYESGDGSFWVGTDLHGLYAFDRSKGTFARIQAAGANSINVIREAKSGELWVGGSFDLARYAISQGTLLPFDDGAGTLLEEEVRTIEVMRNGEVWSAGSAGLVSRFAADGTLLDRISMRSIGAAHEDAIRSLLEDSNGQKWIGLIGGGVKALSDTGEIIATLAHSPRDPYTLNTNTAYVLFEDKAGVLWVGSLEAGLSKSVLGSGGFTHLRHIPGDATSLSDNMVIEIAEDEEGGIWVGSSGGGLNYLPAGAGRFVNYLANSADPSTLASDRVWGMYLEPDGPLWVGTWGGGLNRFDRNTAAVRRYLPGDAPGALPGAIVTAVVGDGDGGVFAGLADGGLVHLAQGSDVFSRLPLFDASEELERPINIAALYFDSRGRLWVGTWRRGLCVADGRVREFRCHIRNHNNKRSINDDNIRAIAEDEAGIVWIATGNGIARYDEESAQFERFTAADGLMPGVVYGIVPEGDGVLWLSSNRGLMRFDSTNRSGRHYEYRDGLQANEFNGGAALKTRSGHIIFGGVGGITRFKPSELVDNPLPPTVVITDFSLFNKSVPFRRGDATSPLTMPVSETQSLELDYDQNFIGFEFAGLHFVSPARNRYAYKLEGLDLDWTETDAGRRFASYANLAPGDYVFRVRAANSDGVWSVEDAVIDIRIAPPWWLTWWAKSLMVLLAAMLLLLFIQWRLSLLRVQTRQLAAEVEKRTAQIVAQKDTIERQAAHLEDALESKSRFFARLSHEFRTPITLILGPIDESIRAGLPEKSRQLLALARHNGERLLHLVDQLLTLARHGGQQHVERTSIAFAPVVRLVVAEFDSAAAQKGIALTLDAVNDLWVSSNADALQTILINLLSNALKYTGAGGKVTVTLQRVGSDAVLKVADTGIGIAPQDLGKVFNLFERGSATGPGTGIGLTLVKELVDAHNGVITIDSVPGAGTTVTVTLTAVAAVPGVAAAPLVPMDIDLDVYTQGAVETPSVGSLPTENEIPEVLVIDDNNDMRRFLVDLLSPDYRCIEARDGSTGLAAAIERIPDAVICDVMMPGLDGFEVLERLRGDEHTSHIPIIMLTARGDEASRLKGLKERADDYIAKPFNSDELRYRLRNLLELNQLRAERTRQQLLAGETAAQKTAEMPGLTTRDQSFLDRLGCALEQHFADAEFGANELANTVHMSHRQLQRKLKALMDVVPATYLRDFRLQKAREQLESGQSVTEAALDCGFSSPGYFARCFAARYGKRPSDVANR
jgi:signal transduction histidine kinase/DNA-binding response OmpR family regulator/streptogramin lyase